MIADDSTLLREGLARLLEEAGIEVVGQAGTQTSCCSRCAATTRTSRSSTSACRRRRPTRASRAAREIRAKHPETGVLVLSQHVAHTYAVELLADSAEGLGYLLKDRVADVDEFSAAVQRVAEGGSALDPLVVAELVGRNRGDDPIAAAVAARARGARADGRGPARTTRSASCSSSRRGRSRST